MTRSRVPDALVSPELLMLEMMAQTGALLLGAERDFQEDVIFAKIDGVSFYETPVPGEMICVESDSDQLRSEGAWFQSRIRKASSTIAESRFLLMNVGHLVPGFQRSITFHDAFMNHFSIRNKVQS